jgi:hypothetical protein
MLFLPKKAFASSDAQFTLLQRAKLTPLIAKIKVLSIEIQEQPDEIGHIYPFTLIQAQVLEHIKGAPPPETITIRFLDSHPEEDPSGQNPSISDFNVSEIAVVFLNNAQDNVYSLRSLSKKKYPIVFTSSHEEAIEDETTILPFSALSLTTPKRQPCSIEIKPEKSHLMTQKVQPLAEKEHYPLWGILIVFFVIAFFFKKKRW